jgi:hypothetical protein
MDGTKQNEEILNLERKYWGAVKDRDVETAMALTDFPCLIAGAQGIRSVDEATFEKMMKSQAFTIEKLDVGTRAEVRRLTDDVAIIAYELHEELVVEGKRKVLDAADSSTWIRRDGQWRCALHSETMKSDG